MDFPPTHPGEVLLEDFLEPLGMGVDSVANRLGVDVALLAEVVEGHRPITADLALRLARLFGTSPEFWLGMQNTHDLDVARDSLGIEIESRVRPLAA